MPTRRPLNAPPSPLELPALITRYLHARRLGKRHYDRATRLLEVILLTMNPGDVVHLAPLRTATLTDLYATSNKVFRSHGIPRFEIVVTDL